MATKYRSKWQAALLLLPLGIATGVFLYWPALNAFRLSLYRTQPGIPDVFVGLDNFQFLLSSSTYQSSVFWSFAFAFVVVVGSISLSLVIGYLIYRASRGSAFYLVVGMISYGFSFAVAAVAVQFILQPEAGLLHSMTGWSFDWLTNRYLAFSVVSIATIWKMIGFNLIFIVGALSGIPETINDAARLDDIRTTTMFFRVHLPLIAPTLAFLIIMNTVYAFFLPFPVVDIMTKGSPGTTNLLIYELFVTGIAQANTGLAAAQSIVLFIIVGSLMVAQLIISERNPYVGGA